MSKNNSKYISVSHVFQINRISTSHVLWIIQSETKTELANIVHANGSMEPMWAYELLICFSS